MIDWYPIINGKCNKCGDYIPKCPIENIALVNLNGKNQIVIKDGFECLDECHICQENCTLDAITYYDGTEESILNSFSGNCDCH